jgi:hypothetical protein
MAITKCSISPLCSGTVLITMDFIAEVFRGTNVVESSFATVRHRLYPSGEGWRLRNGTAIAAHHENVFRSAAEIMRGSTIVRIPVSPE